jgi:hypothetical protein
VTSIRVYASSVLFSQSYVSGNNNTAVPGSDLLSFFPSFHVLSTPKPLGFLSYTGAMVGASPSYGVWGNDPVNSGLEGGPIGLFTSDLSLSFVLSSASNFMAASQVRRV